MPTQMKLVYDVNTHHFNAEYSYELMYSNDSVKTASIIAEEWFEEEKTPASPALDCRYEIQINSIKSTKPAAGHPAVFAWGV